MAADAGGDEVSGAPTLSVIVPSRNEAGTVRACLEALMSQTVHDYEVLLVDSGSTDGTLEIAREHDVRIVQDGLNGPSGARNLGIAAARGDLLAFTDADCVPEKDWLERMIEVFDERPQAGGVGGALRMPRTTFLGRLEDASARVNYRGVITSNAAYRRDVLETVGGFDEALCCGEDWDLAWRARDAGYEVFHDRRPVVTHDPPELKQSVLAFLQKELWYGRHDVRTHARAGARALRDPRLVGSRSAFGAAGDSALNVACVATMLAGAAAASPALAAAGAGLTLARASRAVLRLRDVEPLAARHLPGAVALQAARIASRAFGTVTGYADLAVEQARAAASAKARPERAPAAESSARPAARAAPPTPIGP